MVFSVQALTLITPELEAALYRQGIIDSERLLAAVQSPDGSASLAESTGIPASVVLELAAYADLGRVRGIGSTYAELLIEAGIDSVQALAGWDAAALHGRLTALNAEHWIACRAPSLSQVTEWIATAQTLPALME